MVTFLIRYAKLVLAFARHVCITWFWYAKNTNMASEKILRLHLTTLKKHFLRAYIVLKAVTRVGRIQVSAKSVYENWKALRKAKPFYCFWFYLLTAIILTELNPSWNQTKVLKTEVLCCNHESTSFLCTTGLLSYNYGHLYSITSHQSLVLLGKRRTAIQTGCPPPPPPQLNLTPEYRRGKKTGGVLLLEKNLGPNRSCGGLLWKTLLYIVLHYCIHYKEEENFLQLRIFIKNCYFSLNTGLFHPTPTSEPLAADSSKYTGLWLADGKLNLVSGRSRGFYTVFLLA